VTEAAEREVTSSGEVVAPGGRGSEGADEALAGAGKSRRKISGGGGGAAAEAMSDGGTGGRGAGEWCGGDGRDGNDGTAPKFGADGERRLSSTRTGIWPSGAGFASSAIGALSSDVGVLSGTTGAFSSDVGVRSDAAELPSTGAGRGADRSAAVRSVAWIATALSVTPTAAALGASEASGEELPVAVVVGATRARVSRPTASHVASVTPRTPTVTTPVT
jgi:hypothetical protein